MAACFDIRRRVFIVEQDVPVHEDVDGRDDACVHVVARVEGETVGTARLRIADDGSAKVERVAVLTQWRGKGIGEALMAALEDHAQLNGHDCVVLASQVHALGFYERIGYQAEGPVFMDAGIPHRRMVKVL